MASTSTSTALSAPVEIAWSGRLDDSFTSVARHLLVGAGPLWASVSWSGSTTLHVELACASLTTAQDSSSGAYLQLQAAGGGCTVTISEVHPSGVLVGYDIVLGYRRPPSSS